MGIFAAGLVRRPIDSKPCLFLFSSYRTIIMAEDNSVKQNQYHILHMTSGETAADPGAPVYDTVEVEEVHNGPTEEITSEFNDDGMGVTEIEADTGLQLSGLTSAPPAAAFTVLPRRQRSYTTPEVVVKVKTKPRAHGKKARQANRQDTAGEKGSTGPFIRPFQLKWLLMYEWLRYDPDRKYMHCHWCQESGKKNAFGKAEGTNNFRKSNCDEHQKGNDHKKAREEHGLKHHTYRKDVNGLEDPIMRNVTAVRNADGSITYQGNATLTSSGAPSVCQALEQNPDLRFHAKKAHMLLSGFLCQKNLPTSLSKDMLEIMPFMFPDSKIAAEIAGLNL